MSMSEKTARRTRPMSEATKRAAALYVHAREGSRKAQFQLSEAIAAGDFIYPFEPLLLAQVSKVYRETYSNVEQWTTPKTVQGIDRPEPIQGIVISDSDQSNIPSVNRGDTWIPGTLPSIGPREKYPQIGLAPYYQKTISASKVGEAFGIDWEAIVNSRGGQVDLIDQAVTSFGRHAKQTEDVRALKQLVNASGFTPNVVAQGRAIPGNPDFSSLKDFADALAYFVQHPLVIDGNIQQYTSFTMLVAPGYKYLYDRMINQRAFETVPARTGSDSAVPGLQYAFDVSLPININVVEVWWLPILWPSVGKGYILLPNDAQSYYPVLTLNKLAGYPEPTVWVKDANARQYRGAEIDTVLQDGDFDSDSIETKVRHVVGSDLLWGNGILYSDGSNN
jgi:hypothetical protein